MSEIIIGFTATYLLMMVFLGLRAQRQGKRTGEDYFVAGRSVSWFHLGLTFFASWFSTLAFLGVVGFHYKFGISWYLAQGTFWMLAPLFIWILGRHVWVLGQKHGYITPGDLLGNHSQSKAVKVLTGLMCITALLPYSLVQLVGIGKVFEASTDGSISYAAAITMTTIATALYTVLGGVRAIIWTDIIQGVLFLSVTVCGVFIAIDAATTATGGLVDGLRASVAAAPELFYVDLEKIGRPLTTILIWTPGLVLLPHLWQRNYMARSEEAFTKGIVCLSVLSFVMLIATALIGTLGLAIFSSLSDTDKLVPILFREYAPLLLPLLVLATFAAGMSTIDSQLLTSSSVVIRDLLSPLGFSRLMANQEKLIARIVVVFLILTLNRLALLPGSQGAIFTLAGKGTALSFLFLVPLIGALLSKHIQGSLVFLTLLVGVVVFVFFEFGGASLPYEFGPPWPALLFQLLVFFPLKRFFRH